MKNITKICKKCGESFSLEHKNAKFRSNKRNRCFICSPFQLRKIPTPENTRANEVWQKIDDNGNFLKKCPCCDIFKPFNNDNFILKEITNENGIYKCRKCRQKRVKKLQRHKKEKLVSLFGGKCCLCNYNKCLRALDFHHIDPASKLPKFKNFIDFSFEDIVKELEKCILVCANCHREIHDGLYAQLDLMALKRINTLIT